MIKWILFTSLFSFYSTCVSADIYKCSIEGVDTYSQIPCAEDAKTIKVTPPAKLSSVTTSEAELIDECVAYFKRAGDFKDSDSIKVEGHFFDWLQDDSGARRVLQIKVNAKNSYGAYAGAEYRPCFLNYNGTKLSENQKYIFN